MIKSIRHTGIVVQNLEKAVFFWKNVMGFKLDKKLDESGKHLDIVLGLEDVKVTTVKMSALDGTMIELLKFYSHSDKREWRGRPFTTGLTHIALTVNNLSKTCQKLVDNGVIFIGEPQLSPDGYAKFVFGRGPENLLIEFVEVL